MELKREQEVTHQLMKDTIKDEDNPLNSLLFGVGQPLKVYWENGNFNQCRFEGYSSNFLFWLRLIILIPHLAYTLILIVTNNADFIQFFYWWTLWGWANGIISQVLSMLAAWKPEYWHVQAYAWLEGAHGLNLAVTFAFWCILLPMMWVSIPAGFPSTNDDYFMILHMSLLHLTPLFMTWVNVYFTDIKMLTADWKIMAWHGILYIFGNYLGQFGKGTSLYRPVTD